MAFKHSLCFALGMSAALVVLPTNADGSFDQYIEGALKVYSQFQSPSKQESEQFYSFVKTKWQKQNCTKECIDTGTKVALEYAVLMNTPMESH